MTLPPENEGRINRIFEGMRFSQRPTTDYVFNAWVARIPLVRWRMWFYRKLGLRFGEGTRILMNCEFRNAKEIQIGPSTIINQSCYLDGRKGLQIGSNVNISPQVMLMAGSHQVQDGEGFGGNTLPIRIEDYVWLCTRCTVLGGVTIGRGAVVCAGAVVTRDVEPYAIVGGVPARKVGERTHNLRYDLGGYDVSWR